MARGGDIIIGIDAGTSVIKSIAFDLGGRQLEVASTPNRYTVRTDGAAFQPLADTWDDCARTLRDLGEKLPGLADRVVAIAVTAQGDGTVDAIATPVWIGKKVTGSLTFFAPITTAYSAG